MLSVLQEHDNASTADQAAKWEEQRQISRYAANMPQLETGLGRFGRQIPSDPSLWACDETGRWGQGEPVAQPLYRLHWLRTPGEVSLVNCPSQLRLICWLELIVTKSLQGCGSPGSQLVIHLPSDLHREAPERQERETV